LIWFLRWPGCTPKVPSKDAIICEGVTSAAAGAAAGAAPANIDAVVAVAEARARNTSREPLRKKEELMRGTLLQMIKSWHGSPVGVAGPSLGLLFGRDREPLRQAMQSDSMG
jgi:hypothetical protein